MDSTRFSHLSEVYSAIQGEGPLVGVRQIFIRFSVCDLRCVWCDTPDSLVKNEYCAMEESAGNRTFKKIKNPIDLDNLVKCLDALNPSFHHSFSLTGGEPLLQNIFLQQFIPIIKEQYSLPVYLETGGHRPSGLKKVINFIDFVSMDFKLPSSAGTGNLWDRHKEFLKISLAANKLVWVKIVLTDKTTDEDLKTSLDLIKSFSKLNNPIEVFLQPVTEQNGSKPPSETKLLDIHMKLLKQYLHIRVLPQTHKLIGQK
jgi:organic radical activating enzyme